jgi:TRAP-type mannitol/chloroaromatic compound transport system substrate-binding protein
VISAPLSDRQPERRRRFPVVSGLAGLMLALFAALAISACHKVGEKKEGAAPAAPAASSAQFKWKMQSLWQAGSINHKVFERFCARVFEATGGRLEITPLPVGAVVAYNETLDAVGSGVLDGQQSGPGYFAGKDPGFVLLSEFPGGYETPWQMQAWFEYGGGRDLARELYAKFNVFYIGSSWHGMESIPSKRALRGVDDLKGLKIRIPEGPNQEIFKALGAAPVNIPGSEVYTSLDRGVIDATDWGTLGMNVDLGYHKIAPYQIFPGFHSLPMSDVAVNMERWKELPADIKAILEMAVRDFARDMIEQMSLADAEAARKVTAEGVKLVTWDAAERRKFRQVAARILEGVGQRGPMARKIYDSHVAFLKQLGLLD